MSDDVVVEVLELAMGLEALGRRAARAVASDGLLEVDARLLLSLLASEETQAGLARSLSMDTGQVARTVRRLTDKGMVELRPGKKTGPVRLTFAGRQAGVAAEARKLRVVRQYVSDADGAELSRLYNACKKISDRHYTDYAGPFVRPGGAGDFGAFMRVAARTLRRGYFGSFDERIEAYLAQSYVDYVESKEGKLFLVAEFQGEIRGGLIAVPQTTSMAHMPAFVVEFDYSGRLIGTALLEAAVSRLRQLGISALSTVAPRDPDDESFFKHQGWIHQGSHATDKFGACQTLDEWELRF